MFRGIVVGVSSPPTMSEWNLALRFGLEVLALAGLAALGWSIGSGSTRWVLVLVLPIGAALCWWAFNVVDDPSRSGAAPVPVQGPVRLVIEVMLLGAGGAGFLVSGPPLLGALVLLTAIAHYVFSWPRVVWLLEQV